MVAPKLLLVEDDPALAELLEFRFQGEGYDVRVTADGDEALMLAAEAAREIVLRDAKVDAFYDSIFRNLVSHMVENPASITSAAQLLFVARNIERIGDHATNIAEQVYYAATGTYLPERDDVIPPR